MMIYWPPDTTHPQSHPARPQPLVLIPWILRGKKWLTCVVVFNAACRLEGKQLQYWHQRVWARSVLQQRRVPEPAGYLQVCLSQWLHGWDMENIRLIRYTIEVCSYEWAYVCADGLNSGEVLKRHTCYAYVGHLRMPRTSHFCECVC